MTDRFYGPQNSARSMYGGYGTSGPPPYTHSQYGASMRRDNGQMPYENIPNSAGGYKVIQLARLAILARLFPSVEFALGLKGENILKQWLKFPCVQYYGLEF